MQIWFGDIGSTYLLWHCHGEYVEDVAWPLGCEGIGAGALLVSEDVGPMQGLQEVVASLQCEHCSQY